MILRRSVRENKRGEERCVKVHSEIEERLIKESERDYRVR